MLNKKGHVLTRPFSNGGPRITGGLRAAPNDPRATARKRPFISCDLSSKVQRLSWLIIKSNDGKPA